MNFSESLKNNRDFNTVYNHKKSYANKYLVMYVKPNVLNRNRVGISVSKKVGNSIIRHRVTRLVRESYRIKEDLFLCGFDIVIIARPSTKGIAYNKIESALMHVAKIHRILGE